MAYDFSKVVKIGRKILMFKGGLVVPKITDDIQKDDIESALILSISESDGCWQFQLAENEYNIIEENYSYDNLDENISYDFYLDNKYFDTKNDLWYNEPILLPSDISIGKHTLTIKAYKDEDNNTIIYEKEFNFEIIDLFSKISFEFISAEITDKIPDSNGENWADEDSPNLYYCNGEIKFKLNVPSEYEEQVKNYYMYRDLYPEYKSIEATTEWEIGIDYYFDEYKFNTELTVQFYDLQILTKKYSGNPTGKQKTLFTVKMDDKLLGEKEIYFDYI